MECPSCKNQIAWNDKFCAQCGTQLQKPKETDEELPYVGESVNRAVFRITFEPVEATFDSEDGAIEAAEDSMWGEDREFDDYTIKRIRSEVPPSEFPFICSVCKNYVSTTDKGRCGDCGAVAWMLR
jgi:predicted amidophosphoribosyltransferase